MRNWATSGPTISPDLGPFDAINLDSDLLFDATPGTVQTSQNRDGLTSAAATGFTNPVSGYQTSIPLDPNSNPGGLQFDPLNYPSSALVQEDPFASYMNFEFDPNTIPISSTNTNADTNSPSTARRECDKLGIQSNSLSLPSPGVFATSSSSTPAPSSRLNQPDQQSTDHTPTSSHSL